MDEDDVKVNVPPHGAQQEPNAHGLPPRVGDARAARKKRRGVDGDAVEPAQPPISDSDKERFKAFLPVLTEGFKRYARLLPDVEKARLSLAKVRQAKSEQRVPPALKISVKPQLDAKVFEAKAADGVAPKETWTRTIATAERELLDTVLVTRERSLASLEKELAELPERLVTAVTELAARLPAALREALPSTDDVRVFMRLQLAAIHASFLLKEDARKAEKARKEKADLEAKIAVQGAPTMENLAQLVNSAVKRELAKHAKGGKADAKPPKSKPKNGSAPAQSAQKKMPQPQKPKGGQGKANQKGSAGAGAGNGNPKSGVPKKKHSGSGPKGKPSRR